MYITDYRLLKIYKYNEPDCCEIEINVPSQCTVFEKLNYFNKTSLLKNKSSQCTENDNSVTKASCSKTHSSVFSTFQTL